MARKGYARALWNYVADKVAEQQTVSSRPEHAYLLDIADTQLNSAQELLARTSSVDEEVFFDRATIARLRGDAAEAELQYRSGSEVSKIIARQQGRQPDWDFDFALACLYAKLGRSDDAFALLEQVVPQRQAWSQQRERVEDG